MKLRVRDPKGNMKEIEIEKTDSVKKLRELAAKEFSASTPNAVKLVNKGKLLTDTMTIESAKLEENDLVMILIVKSKEQKDQKKQQEEEAHKEEINELVAEGFDRQQAISALRRADWDNELALQYLEEGLEGEGIGADPLPGNSILNMNSDQIDNLDDEELNNAIDEAIDQFMTSPQFRTMREQIRNNPGSINQFSEQLRQLNPSFHELVMDNPEIIQELIEGVNEFTEEELENMEGLEGEGGDEEEGDDEWEDIDQNENPVQPLNNQRKYCSPSDFFRT